MSLKISGVIIATFPEISGTSKSGNNWRKREFVLEATEGKFPPKIAFQVMNDKIDNLGLALGQTVELDISIESREYNGRWFTSVMAWGATIKSAPETAQPTTASSYAPSATPAQAVPTTQGVIDDLPF